MKYTFSENTVAEFYGRQFYSITNELGELCAYSERIFEIEKEVVLHPGKTLIFEKAVLKKSLTELAGVAKVASISETEFVLQQGTNRDIRPEIMKFAVKNSLNILSMTEQSKSLEQVFQDLTK